MPPGVGVMEAARTPRVKTKRVSGICPNCRKSGIEKVTTSIPDEKIILEYLVCNRCQHTWKFKRS